MKIWNIQPIIVEMKEIQRRIEEQMLGDQNISP